MEFKLTVETQYSPWPISFFKEFLDDKAAVDQAKAILLTLTRCGGERNTSVGLQVEREGRTIVSLTYDDYSPRHGTGHRHATPLDDRFPRSGFQWAPPSAD